MAMTNSYTNVPADELQEFRRVTRNLSESAAVRAAIAAWVEAHRGNTDPIQVERPTVVKDTPGRPQLKPGFETASVHFRVDGDLFNELIAFSVGLSQNAAILNAIRWYVETKGEALEIALREQELANAIIDADFASVPKSVLYSIVGTLAAFEAIDKDALPEWIKEQI